MKATATAKRPRPFKPRVIIRMPQNNGFKRLGNPRWIAGNIRTSISNLMIQVDKGRVRFSDVMDVFRLGTHSLEMDDGNMVSYELTCQFRPRLLTTTIFGGKAEMKAPTANVALIKHNMAFSFEQVLRMTRDINTGSRALVKDGRSNMFPVQVSEDHVMMVYMWFKYDRWNIRVSNFGYGRGTDAHNVVLHLRNKTKK